MFIERNPWIVPIGCVLFSVTTYFSIVLVNQVDKSDLLGSWFLLVSTFVCFATIAVAVYRSMRRSRDPQVMDEAKPKQSH